MSKPTYPTQTCPHCGIEFVRKYNSMREQICCSRSCARQYPHKTHVASSKRCRPHPCLHCGVIIIPNNQKFCSIQCQHNYQYTEYIRQWQSGEIDGTDNGKVPSASKHIKRFIREKYQEKCCICGWAEANPITGNITTEVEHIDGNRRNNREDNLRILCLNCHSLTPTFRGLNARRNKTGGQPPTRTETQH